MKKIFSLAVIAVFGVLLFASCKKNTNGGNIYSFYCKCSYPSAKGGDSLVAQTNYGSYYTKDKATIQCKNYQASIQNTYPGSVCNLQ